MHSFKSKYLIIGIFVVALLADAYFIFPNLGKKTIENQETQSTSTSTSTAIPAPEIVDKQASFGIFTNGTFRVFTSAMYHNLSPDVYIEASNPNGIRIKKEGVTWNDFFSTLPFKLTHECLTTGTGQTFCTGSTGTLQFYINGEKSVNALDQQINNGDRLLVTFGNESETAIQKQLDTLSN